MNIALAIHAYAWIGWLILTLVFGLLWWGAGVLGKEVWSRLRRVYHLTVIAYWLNRIEKEGTRIFRKAELDAEQERMRNAWELTF